MHGKVILDTLFHSGNVNDRFIELDSKSGNLDWSSARTTFIDKKIKLELLLQRLWKKLQKH